MQSLVLILSDYSYPYLKELLTDVRLRGTELKPFLDADCDGAVILLEDENFRVNTLILTDCMEGISLAGSYDTACVYYERPGDEMYDKGDISGGQCIDMILQGFDEVDADFLYKVYLRHHHMPWTILKTDRLTLREMTVEDIDRLYEIYADPDITRYTEPLYEDKLEEKAYTVDYIKNQYEFCGYGLWLAVENDTGRIVGRIGITNRAGYEEAEIGYVIEKSRQGRGYAGEALKAVIDHARDVLGMRALNCFVIAENLASVRLCEKLDFQYKEDVLIKGETMRRYYRIL